jgi:anti-sigma B factor antagonist
MNSSSPADRADSDALAIDHGEQGDVHVIIVRGEVDIGTTPLLSSALGTAVLGGRDRVVIDMSDVSFIDSSGLSVLLSALRRLTREGRTLAVACREGELVHRLLAFTDLLGSLSVHRSRESAVDDGDDRIRNRVP